MCAHLYISVLVPSQLAYAYIRTYLNTHLVCMHMNIPTLNSQTYMHSTHKQTHINICILTHLNLHKDSSIQTYLHIHSQII